MYDKIYDDLVEHGAKMDMQVKQDIFAQITKESLEMINFDAPNMSPIMFNHIRDRDVLIIAWKIGQTDLRPLTSMQK